MRKVFICIIVAAVLTCAANIMISSTVCAETSQIGTAEAVQMKVNINEASATELASLPGIGKTRASAIIAYREKNGGFGHIDDLRKVEGIGRKTFENIRENLTVK